MSTSINQIKLSKFPLKSVEIDLPASKSISNRAIVINKLSREKAVLKNMSNARDTELMLKLIGSDSAVLDAKDAGTTMRFLTAASALSNKLVKLTGTERMQQRPIKILGDCLTELGAKIEYLNKEGFPPHKITPITDQKAKKISIPGNISSQYISALAMIAPCLEKGLEIEITGELGSRPYIEMTCNIMRKFGANVTFSNKSLIIEGGGYEGTDSYFIEPDWSAASYWYSFLALSDKGEILLKGLKSNSIQGDSVIAEIMRKLGVETEFSERGAHLSKTNKTVNSLEWDFKDCPDLAQTVFVVCAALKVPLTATGLESLRIKETDRIVALQNELGKYGVEIMEESGVWRLTKYIKPEENHTIETYEDHRMAMAFAPLCMINSLNISEPHVVRKSYPHFWTDIQNIIG